jgi:hypothetical protein
MPASAKPLSHKQRYQTILDRGFPQELRLRKHAMQHRQSLRNTPPKLGASAAALCSNNDDPAGTMHLP